MIYLILDTNVWLYLANGLDPNTRKHSEEGHFELLKKLQDFTGRDEILVWVNEIIVEEFKRNSEHSNIYLRQLGNKLKHRHHLFNEIRKHSNNHIAIANLEEDYKQSFLKQIERNKEHIVAVQKFLGSCVKIPIPDFVKLNLVELALKKTAPFHNNKNNFADACILFSMDEYLSRNPPLAFDKAIFVSNNFLDFCSKEDKSNFHTDIQKRLKSEILSFDRHLPSALNLSAKVIEEMNAFYEVQKSEMENTFSCQSDWCIRDEYNPAHGIFTDKLLTTSDDDILYNPNQLDIFDDYPSKEPLARFTKLGYCDLCGSLHLECPECSEILTDMEVEDEVECQSCNTLLNINLKDSTLEILTEVDNER